MSVNQPKYCRFGKYCWDKSKQYKCLVPTARCRSMWVSSYDACMKYCGRELAIILHGRLDYDNVETSLLTMSHYAEMVYNPYQVIGKCKILMKKDVHT